jgi:membrane protein implicated in regulation of membrane protease activity
MTALPHDSDVKTRAVSAGMRAVLGFFVGLAFMAVAVSIFFTSTFDFEAILSGVRAILVGVNPWAPAVNLHDYYNPPHTVIFLWPMLFLTPKIVVTIGGALLMAVAFYQKTWVGLAWFGTNILLYLIAAGNIDMLIIGGGLLLLFAADAREGKRGALALRVIAYGLLMIKPQAGLFIVGLYVLLRRDWKGALIAVLVYGLLFAPLWSEWVRHLLTNPPLSQSEAAQSLWGKFGPLFAAIVATGVVLARRWKYWQLGGLLAGILAPYAMPGLPIFLALCAVRARVAIPIVILFSAGLASMALTPPAYPIPNIYDFINPMISLYHLSMLGLALALAIVSPEPCDDRDTIAVGDVVWRQVKRLRR